MPCTLIVIEGISIEMQRKRVKNMTLRVLPPDGVVKLSVPWRSAEPAIRRFVLDHLAWIHEKKLKYQGAHPEQRYQYEAGENHYLEGRQYELRLHDTHKRPHVNVTEDGYLDLHIRPESSSDVRQKALFTFYRQLMQARLAQLIPYWESKLGVSAVQYQLRWMKSRWGSCLPSKKKISLNISLMKYPASCLEYVLVHELVHFFEGSHNARFKQFMDAFMPNWREHKAVLEFHR